MTFQTHDETLTLYVVGTKSGDPADWSPWDELSLVVASSPEEAVALADRPGDMAHTVEADRGVLVTMPEPAWGDDL